MEPKYVGNVRVVSGIINVRDVEKNDSNPVQVHRAEKIIMHPEYDMKTVRNDIALIKMARPIKFNDYAVPVCLPAAKEDLQNIICTVSGWGYTHGTKWGEYMYG